MLKARLEEEMQQKQGFSDEQYGFRKEKSTIDAVSKIISYTKNTRMAWITKVTVDVRNAFNTVVWSIISNLLKELEISTLSTPSK
ncbi:hypothetical protein JTB14_017280 [Gonioctena quinquepunctata]|nr:hypothetical protein JTB14_017280 [Gonioctena quinquepunctata]